MTTTTTTNEPISPLETHDTTTSPNRRLRTAGVAGFVWLTLLLVTNILNGAVAPSPDATVDDVVAHVTDDRMIIYLVTAGFAAGTPFVLWFVAGIAEVLRRNGRTQAAVAGSVGIAAVFAMFALAAMTRLALVAAAETSPIDDSAIWTMWKLHDVAFVVNGAGIAAVLVAFGVAGAAVGLVPHWFSLAAPIGGVLLLASATFLTLPVAEGSNPAMLPSLVGFIIWLAFIGAASLGLLRADADI